MGTSRLVLLAFGLLAEAHKKVAYRFVQLTDIHMEPFYNPHNGHNKGDVCRVDEAFNKSQCIPFRIEPEASIYPFGRLNCDAPHALMRSLFKHIETVATEVKKKGALFGIFTGDIPSHQLSCQRHQGKTIEFVVSHMAKNLKPVLGKIYPLMGNNDFFPNYNVSLEPNSAWQELVASIYEANGLLGGPQLETFKRGGFYSAEPVKGLKLIALNTVVWSQKVLDWESTQTKEVVDIPAVDEATWSGPNAPIPVADISGWSWNTDVVSHKELWPCEKRPRDPYGQLAWLEAELRAAREAKQRVVIAGHVPPGNKVGDNNFCVQYLRDLTRLVRENADLIEVQIYGDHSNDEFRMVWSDDKGEAHAVSSVLVSAGVTPRKHCNPSWRLFEVTEDHRVHDFTQYYLPLVATDIVWSTKPEWVKLHREGKDELLSSKFWRKQYSFREQYGVGLSPPELEMLWVKMQSSPKLLKDYLAQMFSQTVGVHDYFDYICDMRYLDEEENEECYKRGRLLSAAPPPVAVEAIDFAEVDHENTGPKYVQIHPAMLGSLIGCLLITTGSTLYLFVRSRAASKDVYLQMP
ncbi:unnamed protein product [Effrenium voratum]|uniref:Calcineurin-like phosphoesterase domain-containing protein n=1 Tax=Effrenium voratum TaxID=2562239 RepID=A0AA36N500_9DINO|nr:unnamed protein product [Effrenium voratum]CAJ1415397.1 unnamed protein product [Effrenium voratum]